MHTRDDLNCTRGYEFWLMKEAKARNPSIITYGMSWGVPGWINNQTGYYGPDNLVYQVNWAKCARDYHGITVDYLGLWNERGQDKPAYIKELRQALDAASFTETGLVVMDGGYDTGLIGNMAKDPSLTKAISAIGLHYPCDNPHPEVQQTFGKKYWSSEDWWSEAEWGGAACWAKLLNQNFVRMNMTSTISWSTIWGVYPVVDVYEGEGDSLSGDGYWGPGLMYAWQPHRLELRLQVDRPTNNSQLTALVCPLSFAPPLAPSFACQWTLRGASYRVGECTHDPVCRAWLEDARWFIR
jgi:hypothetical protein